MKIRSGIRSVKAGMALAAMLVSFAALSVPAYGDSSGQAVPTGNALVMSGQPVVLFNVTMPSMVVKYHNQQTTPVNGTLFMDVRNAAGQTVYIASAPLGVVNASASITVMFGIPLPFDAYTTSLFVVDSTFGYAISASNSTSIVA
jgi:hypothetical protein